MATKLIKEISRELLATTPRGATLIATLEPGGLITFREKGRRFRYTVSLHGCYKVAIMQFLQDDYLEKLAEYKAGRRKKKPKAPNFNAFARHLQLALSK